MPNGIFDVCLIRESSIMNPEERMPKGGYNCYFRQSITYPSGDIVYGCALTVDRDLKGQTVTAGELCLKELVQQHPETWEDRLYQPQTGQIDTNPQPREDTGASTEPSVK